MRFPKTPPKTLTHEISVHSTPCVPIDHFHKWRPLLHSFVSMLIRPTALVLKQIFF